MNLTKKQVEGWRGNHAESRDINDSNGHDMIDDCCDDWLAQQKVLEDVRWDKLLCCIECGNPRGYGCGPDCKINELMG